jgi:two-component system cell cycle sensor histidine kinase PleC
LWQLSACRFFLAGKVAYGLRMIFLTESLNRLLADQKLPPDWIAAIVASDGRLLARTHQAQEFVGQPVVPALQAAIASGERRTFLGTTKEGIETQTVVYPVPGTDWSVVVGVPTDSLYGPLQREMRLVYGMGLVLLLVTIAGAYLFSRVIHKDVRGLVNVERVRRGRDDGQRRYRISELAAAAASLRDMR